MPLLEIAVTSLEDAIHAARGGADSIEISRNLSAGGLTPDTELVASIVREYHDRPIAIHVMIRPHARSFVYDKDDVAQIREDVQRFKALQIDGLVFGACDRNGRLDIDLISRVRNWAAPTPLTVHRALDLSIEPEHALARLPAIGINRVLTAGPAATAFDGRGELGKWVKRFGRKIDFVVSGGLTFEQIAEMKTTTGAHVYHFGFAARTNGTADFRKIEALAVRVKSAE